MDIRTFVNTAVLLMGVGVVVALLMGWRAIRDGRRINFYRIRQQRIARGWRLFGLAILLVLAAFALLRFGEPAAYEVFPPSPTVTSTPTITLTPTISLTPTITLTPTLTLTPAESYTPTITMTPFIPAVIVAGFSSTVTPNPDALFSPLQFTEAIDNDYRPVRPATVFENPLKRIYAVFSYDNMTPGAQWTALWYRDGQLVHAETKPWDGQTGGYGFTDFAPSPEKWLPGTYQVQIFVGIDWKVVGQFLVEGFPPSVTPTRSPTITRTPTATRAWTNTPIPTSTQWPTLTPSPVDTHWPTQTPTP